jgi:hypothetical protein
MPSTGSGPSGRSAHRPGVGTPAGRRRGAGSGPAAVGSPPATPATARPQSGGGRGCRAARCRGGQCAGTRALPVGPAQSSVLHDFARSGPTKEAHRRAMNRIGRTLRSVASDQRKQAEAGSPGSPTPGGPIRGGIRGPIRGRPPGSGKRCRRAEGRLVQEAIGRRWVLLAADADGQAASWRLRGLHLDPGSGRMVPRTRVGRSALRAAAPAGRGRCRTG